MSMWRRRRWQETLWGGGLIHEIDPLRDTPCDVCGRPLLLGETVIFDEDDGTHGHHEACHEHVVG